MSAADSPRFGRGATPHLESGPIANHRLLGEIGRGRTSVVYLAAARQPRGYTVFALKHLRAELRGDGAAVAAFRDAARIARSLDHPNLVRSLDVAADRGRYLHGMEFVDGQPFARVVRRARKAGSAAPLRTHLRVLVEVLAALEYLHSLAGVDAAPGLVHREVGPEKVHIAYGGQVKLLGPGPRRGGKLGMQPGVALRRPYYAAPECVQGHAADGRADVFAVGVMLHEAILWKDAAPAAPDGSGDGPVPEGGEAPDADPALLAIARRATQVDPGARYPTAGAMRRALEDYAAWSRLILPDMRDLSLSVGALFAQERQKQQAVIRTRLAALDETGDTGDSPGVLPRITLTPSAPLVLPVRPSARPPAAVPLSAPPVMAPSVPPVARPPAWSSGAGPGIVASVAAIVVAGGVAWRVTSRSAPPAEARGLARSEAPAILPAILAAAPSADPVLPPTVALPPQPPAPAAPPEPSLVPASPVIAVPPVVRPHPTPNLTSLASRAALSSPSPPAERGPGGEVSRLVARSTSAPAPAPTPTTSPLSAPPPKPDRAIHKDNPYLP